MMADSFFTHKKCAEPSPYFAPSVHLPKKSTLRNLELLIIGSYLATGEYILQYRCLSKQFRKITARSYIACGYRIQHLSSTPDHCWVCNYTTSQLRAIAENTGRLIIDANSFITQGCTAHSAYRQVRMLLTACPFSATWNTL